MDVMEFDLDLLCADECWPILRSMPEFAGELSSDMFPSYELLD